MEMKKSPVCVLDASTYVGFGVLKGLLRKGYRVHAAIHKKGGEETELEKKVKEMEKVEERLSVYCVDILEYQSILVALKGCCGLFCCLDNPNWYHEKYVELEVRGVINVMEACAQTMSIEKIVYTSSLTAAIWRENIGSMKNVIMQNLLQEEKIEAMVCSGKSEQAAWALAMDRMLNMVSINAGLVIGPDVTQHNPRSTMFYLKGAPQMYENGVLASVDVGFLVEVNIRAFEDPSTCGRYYCFDQTVKTEEECVKLVRDLSPLISLPQRYECKENEVYAERLATKKLNKLVKDTAY